MYPLLTICLLNNPARAASVDDMAGRLADLRGEVEHLNDELQDQRQDQRATLSSIDAQVADLELQTRRAELRREQLLQEAEHLAEAMEGADDLGALVRPVVLDGLHKLESVMSQGLPYRLPERLEGVHKLQGDVQAGRLSALEAANRSWAMFEDELRLTKDNGLGRQVVDVAGTEVLAEVARIGMVALYYRTQDGQFGHAVHDGATWSWVPVTERRDIAALQELFEAFRKGIRVGQFTLPGGIRCCG